MPWQKLLRTDRCQYCIAVRPLPDSPRIHAHAVDSPSPKSIPRSAPSPSAEASPYLLRSRDRRPVLQHARIRHGRPRRLDHPSPNASKNSPRHEKGRDITSRPLLRESVGSSLEFNLLQVDRLATCIHSAVHFHLLAFKFLHFVLVVDVVGSPGGGFL